MNSLSIVRIVETVLFLAFAGLSMGYDDTIYASGGTRERHPCAAGETEIHAHLYHCVSAETLDGAAWMKWASSFALVGLGAVSIVEIGLPSFYVPSHTVTQTAWCE